MWTRIPAAAIYICSFFSAATCALLTATAAWSSTAAQMLVGVQAGPIQVLFALGVPQWRHHFGNQGRSIDVRNFNNFYVYDIGGFILRVQYCGLLLCNTNDMMWNVWVQRKPDSSGQVFVNQVEGHPQRWSLLRFGRPRGEIFTNVHQCLHKLFLGWRLWSTTAA